AARCRAAGRAFEQRGRRCGAEDVGERLPENGEPSGGGEAAGGVARSTIPRGIAAHCPPPSLPAENSTRESTGAGEPSSEDAIQLGAPPLRGVPARVGLRSPTARMERGFLALEARESAGYGGRRLAPSIPPAAVEARRPAHAAQPECAPPSRRERGEVSSCILRRSA